MHFPAQEFEVTSLWFTQDLVPTILNLKRIAEPREHAPRISLDSSNSEQISMGVTVE